MSELIPEPVAEPVAEPSGEPAWQGPPQEEWQQVVETLGYLTQQFQPQEPEPAPAEQRHAQFDPFSDDPDGLLRQVIREELAPLQQYQQTNQMAQAEELAYDILDSFSAEQGEIVNREEAFPIIRAWADTLMPEMAQRYGFGPQAAEAALEASYKHYKDLESKIGEDYINRRMNQITNLSGARVEPGAIAAGTQNPGSQGGDEMSVVTRFGGFPAPERGRQY
jgi:hypothetical protein